MYLGGTLFSNKPVCVVWLVPKTVLVSFVILDSLGVVFGVSCLSRSTTWHSEIPPHTPGKIHSAIRRNGDWKRNHLGITTSLPLATLQYVPTLMGRHQWTPVVHWSSRDASGSSESGLSPTDFHTFPDRSSSAHVSWPPKTAGGWKPMRLSAGF